MSDHPEAAQRAELAAFLRAQRARLRPADVGRPDLGRRRTPGLRREEVAQLSGVGVTWYTWLEQGRNIAASAQVGRPPGPRSASSASRPASSPPTRGSPSWWPR